MRTVITSTALLFAVTAHATTVFQTDFNSDGINQASYTPTATTTTWNIASNKNVTASTTIASGDLVLGMNATTSGVVEAQTTLPGNYQINDATESITATLVFTDTANVLLSTATNTSILCIGLFQKDSNLPYTGLNTGAGTGLLANTAGSPFATGGTQLWQGFNSRIALDTGTTSILTRAQQSGSGTASSNQDLLLNGVTGGYVNPAPITVSSSNNATATTSMTNGNQYTLVFNITRTDASTLTITNTLYDGAGTGGTNLATISGTATGGNLLTDTFGGLAIGYRYAGTSLASSMTLNNLTVDFVSVPEPSTYAALAGVAGLALAVVRRRRRA